MSIKHIIIIIIKIKTYFFFSIKIPVKLILFVKVSLSIYEVKESFQSLAQQVNLADVNSFIFLSILSLSSSMLYKILKLLLALFEILLSVSK